MLALCPVSYPNALAAGITLYAENACGGIAEQTAGLAGKAFSLTEAEEAGASGPGVIGWYYPDEADLKGITAETLPSFPPPETTHRLRVLTVTNHFYSRTATLPGGRGIYPGLIAKSDVVGFDLYPLQEFCSNAWLPDVAYAQRELVRLAQGRPTFQWIEAQSWKCQQPALRITPATVRAESWLSVAGGARGIGFFPGEWDPSVIPAVEQISKEVAAIGGGLLAPDSPASATGAVVVGARSFGGALYVIAVNPTRTATRSTITAAGLSGRPVGVLEEGRSVAVVGRLVHGLVRPARRAPLRRNTFLTGSQPSSQDPLLNSSRCTASLLALCRSSAVAAVSGEARGSSGSGDRLRVRRPRERGRWSRSGSPRRPRASPAGR